jgi:hypothetical protein
MRARGEAGAITRVVGARTVSCLGAAETVLGQPLASHPPRPGSPPAAMTIHHLHRRADVHGSPSTTSLGGGPGKSTLTSRVVMRARDGNGVGAGAADAVDRATSSTGTALPPALQGRFESSLGSDLSQVRVHTGVESAEAASAVGARAYALGHDIHFADGQYDPSSHGNHFGIIKTVDPLPDNPTIAKLKAVNITTIEGNTDGGQILEKASTIGAWDAGGYGVRDLEGEPKAKKK